MLDFIQGYGAQFSFSEPSILVASLVIELALICRIIESQEQDESLKKLRQRWDCEGMQDWHVSSDGGPRYRGRICFLKVPELKQAILDEAHRSCFTVHPSSTKMYRDVRRQYWWENMKRDIAEYVAKCLTCKQVKAEHRKPPVDRLTKSSRFLPICVNNSVDDLAKLYIQEIVHAYGIPREIVSNSTPCSPPPSGRGCKKS
ncbi:uncharacterized protein LOC131232402 [Magnolia sinica]|uniref:uncharacterized protein LOC131232402 n=1 Tax=Magnolia sinica TaxID=86752 RepID=UPI00265A233E|nr:uncharacterized protein LOC131232402 [Magnolia sinica]